MLPRKYLSSLFLKTILFCSKYNVNKRGLYFGKKVFFLFKGINGLETLQL